MPEESVLGFEADLCDEEILNKAEEAALDRGYDVYEKGENNLAFGDPGSTYELEVTDGEVELYGDSSTALGGYTGYLKSKL